MSLTYGFFNSLNHDRKYNSEQLSALFDGVIRDGVFDTIGDLMAVSAVGGMYVTVGTGRAWFNSTWTYIDTEYALLVEQAELVLPRIDAVVLEVNHEVTERANYLKIIKGTASSDPQPPTMIDTDKVHQHALAYIYVDPNVTEIRQSKITNNVGTSECPFVTGILETTSIEPLFKQWDGEFDDWSVKMDGKFDDWFKDVQDTLDSDTAGKLLNRIVKLEEEDELMRSVTDLVFTANGWTYTAPYEQTRPIAKLKDTDRPVIEATVPESYIGDIDDYWEQAGFISYFDSQTNAIKAVCLNDRPTMDLVISVKGR